jgi:hypothetical protein
MEAGPKTLPFLCVLNINVQKAKKEKRKQKRYKLVCRVFSHIRHVYFKACLERSLSTKSLLLTAFPCCILSVAIYTSHCSLSFCPCCSFNVTLSLRVIDSHEQIICK